MATSVVVPQLPTSFVYENLVARVQTMQNQLIRANQMIEERAKIDQNLRRQLNSRSFVFVDPFGNEMINQQLDHLTIHKVTQKFKKEYCPRYLHSWIRIGLFNNNEIHPLTEDQLHQTVAQYPNQQKFVAYGQVRIDIFNEQCYLLQKNFIDVLLNDKREKFQERIEKLRENVKKKQQVIGKLELKVWQPDSSNETNKNHWNEGKPFGDNDSVFSTRLYETNSFLMAKIVEIE